MQTIVLVFSKKNTSLRDAVIKDEKGLDVYDLHVESKRTKGRPKGWAKVKGREMDGAINIEWDAATKLMICRIITKKGGRPGLILGTFVAYLMTNHSKSVRQISVQVA